MTSPDGRSHDQTAKQELFETLRDDFREFISEWSFYHMKTIRDEGLPLSQFFLLRHLRSFPSTDLTTLTGFLGVTKPTVSGLVDTLEKDGYVRRVQDDSDRRRINIEMTGKSMDLFERLEAETFSLFGDVFLAIPDDVMLNLHETIGTLTERIRDIVDREPGKPGKQSD
jgi:DNA-binding MarR family transcriptional regulator